MARKIQVLFKDKCRNCDKILNVMDPAFLIEKNDKIVIGIFTLGDGEILCLECWDKNGNV